MSESNIIVRCPYCNDPAEWVSNAAVYGREYGKSVMIWLCRKDDAYVGCHQNTQRPLGTMANRELRGLRQLAHRTIDPLWKEGVLRRKDVYYALKKIFGCEVHVGSSDAHRCREIAKIDQSRIIQLVHERNALPRTP